MKEHEKRIREALGYCLETGGVGFTVASVDLRALLADLDAMRGALEHCEGVFMAHEINRVNGDQIADDALEIIRAALKGAEA